MQLTEREKRLSFQIKYCSSQNPEFPVENLLRFLPEGGGWQNERMAAYPQEIVFKLDQTSKLSKLQLLVHEYKIPAKLEIFLSSPEIEGKFQFKRLGYVQFDSNQASNYSVRELKTISVDKEAEYIRIVIHKCHKNNRNTYNQVGIVSVQICGEPISQNQIAQQQNSIGGQQTQFQNSYFQNRVNRQTSKSNESNYSLYNPQTNNSFPSSENTRYVNTPPQHDVDTFTAKEIAKYMKLKQESIQDEDFDEAKRLKQSIEVLKQYGRKIRDLEVQKQQAIFEEDFDLAKKIKLSIAKIREQCSLDLDLVAASHAAQKSLDVTSDPQDILKKVLLQKQDSAPEYIQRIQRRLQTLEENSVKGPQTDPLHQESIIKQLERFRNEQMKVYKDHQNGAINRSEDPFQKPVARVVKDFSNNQLGEQRQQSNFTQITEDQEADISQPDGDEEQQPEDGDLDIQEHRRQQKKSIGSIHSSNENEISSWKEESLVQMQPPQPPDNWPPDLPTPEILAPPDLINQEGLLDLMGRYVTESFFSKHWQLRQAAIQHMQRRIQERGIHLGDREAFKIIGAACIKALKDKVVSIYISGISLLICMAKTFVGPLGSKEVSTLVVQGLQILLDKLGDSQNKVSASSRDAILQLAGIKELNLKQQAGIFLWWSGKNQQQNAGKQLSQRLQLLLDLIPIFGVTSTSHSGFEIVNLMEYINRAFSSASAEIRNLAIQVTLEVSNIYGPKVKRYLPQDLNPKTREQLVKALQDLDNSQQYQQTKGLKQPQNENSAQAISNMVSDLNVNERNQKTPLKQNNVSGKSRNKHGKDAPNQRNVQGFLQEQYSEPSLGGGKMNQGRSNEDIFLTQSGTDSPFSPFLNNHRNGAQGAAPSKKNIVDKSNNKLLFDKKDIDSAEQQHQKMFSINDTNDDLTQHNLEENEAGREADTPTRAKEVLRSRIEQYGDNHTQVAEALNNLAIAYTQQQQFDDAKPLYDRSLQIFEQNYGPDHLEVGHTLVDLAILYLEQGNDAMGKNLLERAYYIQGKCLGTNHPDVLAIKDVLESTF